jgi:hypothetical protein
LGQDMRLAFLNKAIVIGPCRQAGVDLWQNG